MSHPKIASFVRLAMIVASVSAAAAGVANMNGCGTSRPAATDGEGMLPGGNGGLSGPCTQEGAVAECHVETGRIGDTVNCFHGTQICHDGQWGPCGGGPGGGSVSTASISDLLASGGAGFKGVLSSNLGIRAVTATAPSRDASGCAQNLCNPDCMGIDIDAGNLQPEGGFTSTSTGVVGTVSDPTTFPGGATGPKSGAMQGVSSPPSFLCTPPPTGTLADGGLYSLPPPADYKDCSYDYCCGLEDAGPRCLPWAKNAAANNAALATCNTPVGPDLTVGLGCVDGAGEVHVPLCNRGQAPVQNTGTLTLGVYAGNPSSYGSTAVCLPNGGPSDTCSIDLTQVQFPAGECVDINLSRGTAGTATGYTCTGAPTGNRTLMINPPSARTVTTATQAGATVTITTSAAHGYAVGRRVMVAGVGGAALNTGYNGTWVVTAVPTATTFTYTHTTTGLAAAAGGQVISAPVNDGDYCNNYSFIPTAAQGNVCVSYGVQPPPPAALSYTHVATCPAGTRVHWNQMAYDTAVPLDSQVVFQASTAPILSDAGIGPFSTAQTVASIRTNSGDPAYCAFSGLPDAAMCPKNLAAILGSAAYDPVLKIGVTLTAITAIPTVRSWNVSYNCEPTE